MATDLGVVLIHGAGTGSWIWSRVVPLLEAPALLVDLPGRGNVPTDPRTVTLSDAIDSVAAQVAHSAPRDVIVVAHSMAGMLVPGLEDRVGPRLRSSVLVGAAVPLDGGTLLQAMGFPWSWVLRALFAFQPGGTKPPARAIRRALAHDVDESSTDELVTRYVKEPRGFYTAEGGVYPPDLPVTYVKLLQDRSQMSPKRQDVMIRALGSPKVATLDTGHLPMLARPEALAAVINAELNAPARRT